MLNAALNYKDASALHEQDDDLEVNVARNGARQESPEFDPIASH